jgi:hypothetical protein
MARYEEIKLKEQPKEGKNINLNGEPYIFNMET